MRWQPTAGDLENTDLLVEGIEAKVHRARQGQGDSGIAIIMNKINQNIQAFSCSKRTTNKHHAIIIIPTKRIIVEKGLVEAVTIIKLKV